MSREIKFRMVTQTTGKVLGYVDIYDLLRNGSDVLPDFEEAILEGVKFEQYTGLKDKNGKEIYEGDILRLTREVARDKSTLYQVVWDERTAEFDTKNLDETGWDIGYLNETATKEDYMVIGNIHENPELLGGKE